MSKSFSKYVNSHARKHARRYHVVRCHRKKDAACPGLVLYIRFPCRSMWGHLVAFSHIPPVRGSFNWLLGTRVGEASHPGPANSETTMTFAILNPTVLTERQSDIVQLGADVICLAETSATATIQKEFNKFLTTTPYIASWSPPVLPQKTVVNPFMASMARRGEPLGTASLHRSPCRQSRVPFHPVLQESLRVSQQIVLVGHIEVLVVTAYFFAGRTLDVRNKSDLLLAELYVHCAATNLPFLIAADFNNPVRDFPAFRAFQSNRCQEAFHFASTKLSKDLPPTCRNATRNDSFIIHEALVPWIQDIWVGAPDVFPDHSPLFLEIKFPGRQPVARNWFVPASWGDSNLDPDCLEQCYLQSSLRFTSSRKLDDEDEINDAFHRWSKGVEAAVKHCLRLHHSKDPMRYPQPSFPQKFFGRCAPIRFVTHVAPKTIKPDPTKGYDPPTGVTSNKAKLKARQTRRLISLQRQIKKHRPAGPSTQVQQQIKQEWQAIKTAQGYGRSWESWLLSFACVPFVPCEPPSAEWLLDAIQITRLDSDAYARQEARLRAHHKRHCLALARSHTNNSNAYKFIKGKEQQFLNDFPVIKQTQVTLCRARGNRPKFTMHEPVSIPVGARVKIGTCSATVADVTGSSITLSAVQGRLPSSALMQYETHAYHITDMSHEFHSYWSQFWMRDTYQDQVSDEPWQHLLDDLDMCIPAQPMLDLKYDDPKLLWDTIHRLKPYRAVGIDGWHAEELQRLTWSMIVDLARLLGAIWHKGLTPQQMRSRTLLFAKKERPASISDGRPITILGYIARLTSKLISDQILRQWSESWPVVISGGLPRRSARDLCLMQQLQIEHAKSNHTAWGGWTMDLVKAFNLIPRRVIRHIYT